MKYRAIEISTGVIIGEFKSYVDAQYAAYVHGYKTGKETIVEPIFNHEA